MKKILLTGATGYIGKRLLPFLIREGYEVVCCVRDKQRFIHERYHTEAVSVIEADFLKKETLKCIPQDIDGAYYLIHSMKASTSDFDEKEALSAVNFRDTMEWTTVRHVIYLGGIANAAYLSKHLSSRKSVEQILSSGNYNFTTLRAGIILGSGSASFEIIRDLVEKLPFMIAPKWVMTKSHPIAVKNVLEFLIRSLFNKSVYNQAYDIGGPDILSYKDMILRFAKVRKLKRHVITFPLLTPKVSSYWLFFITSTSYSLATNLVNSMKIEVIGEENDLAERLDIKLMHYEEALQRAFIKIQQNQIHSSWKDSLSNGKFDGKVSTFIHVPTHGCLIDARKIKLKDPTRALGHIWRLGGDHGWMHGQWLWKFRGFLDQLAGGVGLRRGRTHPDMINTGDALDFWRVLLADKDDKRLLLYSEMNLPGEAWLEFRIDKDDYLHQIATFRPKGIFGRLYWYASLPVHHYVFRGMIRKITS